MIVIWLRLTEAERLLKLRGFQSLRSQIEPQLAIERALPCDAVPVMTVRFGDLGHDVYDDARAEAMWQAMGKV